MKWQNYDFVWKDVDYHPHNGAEMPAGWIIRDPYGKYMFHVEGELADAKKALITRLDRHLKEDIRVLEQIRHAYWDEEV
jgi:hypothetical protein